MNVARAKRVLVVVWDGADPLVAQAMWRAGQMPGLAALAQNGLGPSPLGTHLPGCSAALWASAFTGKRADQHGILSGQTPDASGIDLRDCGPQDRRGLAIWNILTRAGRPTLVIGAPGTHPAESIQGLMVSDRFPGAFRAGGYWEDVRDQAVMPAEARAELAELRVNPADLAPEMIAPLVPNWSQIDQARDRRLAAVCAHLAQTASLHAAATAAIAERPWDLAIVHYPLLEQLARTFLQAAAPYERVMPAAYAFCDLMLARLRALAGPGTLTLVISGHCRRQAARVCAVGMLAVGGEGVGLDAQPQICAPRVLDLTPTVLAVLGMDVGADMAGRVWHEVFDPVLTTQRRLTWEAGEPGEANHDTPSDVAEKAWIAAMLGRLHAAGVDDPMAGELAKERLALAITRATHRAYACEQGGQLPQAIAAWQSAINLDPRNPLFGLEAIRCLWAHGHAREAAAHAQKFLAKFASSAAAGDAHLSAQLNLLRALVAWQARDLDGALQHLNQAAAHLIPDAGWLCLLGDGYGLLKQHERAAEMFKLACEGNPGEAATQHRLAGALLQTGAFAAAAEAAFVATQLDPTSLAARERLVMALEKAGMHAEAARIKGAG